MDEEFINKTKLLPQKIRESIIKKLQEAIIKANEKGLKSCSKRYNIFLLEDYFVYFIVLASFGYLIAPFLKSYSVVKIKNIFLK